MPCYSWITTGVAVLLIAGSVAAESHLDSVCTVNIEEALDQQREALMRRPGAVGVGIGLHQGKPAIVFMVDRATPEVVTGIPREIKGYPVIVEEVGEITAY